MNNNLIAAVKNNDHASIKSILESEPEISKDLKVALASDQVSIKTRGIFLYYFAITNNKDDFVDLLKHKCDKLFNFGDQDVLKLVIRNNWIDLFDSVYETEHSNNKPLEYAIESGRLDFVKLLLKKGLEVDNNNIENMTIPDSMKEFFLNYESKIPKQSDIGAVVGKEFGSGWCNGFVALFAHYYLNDSLSLYTEMLCLAAKSRGYFKEYKEYSDRYNELFFKEFMNGTSFNNIFEKNIKADSRYFKDYFYQKSLEVIKGQILILQKGQSLILQKPVEGLYIRYYQKQLFNNLSLLSDKVKKLKPQSYVSEFDESSMTSFLEYLQINLTTRRTAIQIYSYNHATFLGFDASTKRFTFWDPNSEKYYVTNDLKQLSNLILNVSKDLSFIINSENAISLPYEKMKISKTSTSEILFCHDADKEAFEYVLSNLNFDLSVKNLSSVKNSNSVEVFKMFGWHVLCSAVDKNDVEKFESCINKFGCDFRDPFDKSTILKYLVQKNRFDLIKKKETFEHLLSNLNFDLSIVKNGDSDELLTILACLICANRLDLIEKKETFEYFMSNLNYDLSVEGLSIFKNGNSIEFFKMFGWHVLRSAVDNNDVKKFESCINKFGCDFRDPFDNSTILTYLVQENRLDLIQKKETFEDILSNLNYDLSVEGLSILKNGNSIEFFKMVGWYVLRSAVDNNDVKKFESCINEFGCDFRDPFDNSTILKYLVQKNRLDLIKKKETFDYLLLNLSFDLSVENLSILKDGDIELFKMFGWHVLCSAVDNNDVEKFESCINEFGRDSIDPFDGSTILMYLVQKKRLDLIEKHDFKRIFEEIKDSQDHNGQTALMYACKGSSSDDSDEMRRIVSYLTKTMKVNQNIKDCNDRTAEMHFDLSLNISFFGSTNRRDRLIEDKEERKPPHP